jgi:hypothetical protein
MVLFLVVWLRARWRERGRYLNRVHTDA